MQRIDILQKLINKNNYNRYVEIGTYKGATILNLKCENKITIDPVIRISWKRKLKWILKNPTNLRNRYFEMTSDDFFGNHSGCLKKGVDIFFIDGLHTFRASLNDVLNSLRYLNKDGTIVMHDCYPPHKAASIAASSFGKAKELKPDGWNGQWCGDVWKTIVYLKWKFSDILEVNVLDTDFGLGIITKKSDVLEFEFDQALYNEIIELDYSYLKSNPGQIGLINEMSLF